MSCVLRGYQNWGGGGREEREGREAPIGPAMPPLPRILSANGSAGIWGGGWRWTETDGSWQTHTDSQWIQGSLAERSEQGWIKDRLTFKVSPCLVPPHCQRGEKSVYGSSVGFSVKSNCLFFIFYIPKSLRLLQTFTSYAAQKKKKKTICRYRQKMTTIFKTSLPLKKKKVWLQAHICNSSDILIRSLVSCVPSRRKNQTLSKWTNLVFTLEAQLLCVCVCVCA